MGERAEYEATWFAIGFLMPEQDFRKAWKLANGNVEQVANKFGVTWTHANLRAKGLGLFPTDGGDVDGEGGSQRVRYWRLPMVRGPGRDLSVRQALRAV